jgi:glutamyl-tRNA synthetase
VFDPEKLEWLNGEHLRALPPDGFVKELQDYLVAASSPLADEPGRVAEAAPLVQEKMRVLGQFPRLAGFLFGPPERDPAAWERVGKDERAPASLRAARAALADVDPWRADAIEAGLHGACEREGVKPRVLFMPVRVALTGSTVSPGLYESLELVGREESLARLDAALADLAG